MTRITRRRQFQRLNPSGDVLTPRGYAFNYYVEVTVSGAKDEGKGMFLNIREIDSLIDWAIQETKPSFVGSESLAEALFQKLSEKQPELEKLRLFESADYWIDVWR